MNQSREEGCAKAKKERGNQDGTYGESVDAQDAIT